MNLKYHRSNPYQIENHPSPANFILFNLSGKTRLLISHFLDKWYHLPYVKIPIFFYLSGISCNYSARLV
jgi:hypothetical protein